MPRDVWFPASEYVKRQVGDQFSTGWFRNFDNNNYEASLEIFYKLKSEKKNLGSIIFPWGLSSRQACFGGLGTGRVDKLAVRKPPNLLGGSETAGTV